MKKTQHRHIQHPLSLKPGCILLYAIDILLIILIVASSAGIEFARRTLPVTQGIISMAGLQKSVQIGRDKWGTPYINASRIDDLLFAQGYVTAQDRLFQMELSRRITQGRLAETFGAGSNNTFIQADTLIRTLGIYRAIQTQINQLDPQTHAAFQAYTNGVNAFISTHRNSLPLEFTILGMQPAPWTIADSMAVEANVVLALDNTWYYKYTRALILARLGPTLTAMLFPPYPAQNPTLLSNANSQTRLSSLPTGSVPDSAFSIATRNAIAALHTLLGNIGSTLGSNNWVVDGTKTTTGKPLLANDPHLAISVPSTWYEVALHSSNFDVIGFSLPGAPGVVIGHNASIAWGVTDVGADTSDLYIEQLDPLHHPGQYLYNKRWLPLQTRHETILVRGQSPVTITVAATRHGPILNYAVSDLKQYATVSLKWTLLQPAYHPVNFLQLDAAANWLQFSRAVSAISLCLNFVYADTSGNIGYHMSGLLPIRSRDNRMLPVDGSTARHEWQGFVPASQMPTLFNPPSHMIVTANNRIVPDNYPVYVATDWDDGYRAQRITNLLDATPRLSITDYQQMQADVYSIPASILTPYFIAGGQSTYDSDTTLAVKLLKQWNYTFLRNSVGATIYEMTASLLLRRLLEPLLSTHLYSIYQMNYTDSGFFTLLINVVRSPQHAFFATTVADTTNAQRDALIACALHDTIKHLQTRYGSDPHQWTWGKMHQAHFVHPLSNVFPLNLLFGKTQLARPGDDETISIGGDDNFNADPAHYTQQTVSSMREIIDLSNFDHSLWIITTGESGQPLSEHYMDLNPLWDLNQYQAMTFSAQQVAKMIRTWLVLNP
jgi:penicillin amidase